MRERIHTRTKEIAARAGRIAPDVAQGDYEQAKREVSAEIASGPNESP